MSLLNEREQHIMNLLADAWNEFCELEEIHSNHTFDFNQHINAAHHIVMIRPVSREFNVSITHENEPQESKGNDEGESVMTPD